MNKKKIIIIGTIILFVLILIPSIIFATKGEIKYTPEGKPYFYYYEEVPEEYKGKEGAIAVPANYASEEIVVENKSKQKNTNKDELTADIPVQDLDEETDAQIKAYLEEQQAKEDMFFEILNKYHGKDKVDNVINTMTEESAPESNGEISSDFPPSAYELLELVIDIFDNKNPTEEEKAILKEYTQSLVRCNNVENEYIRDRILNL